MVIAQVANIAPTNPTMQPTNNPRRPQGFSSVNPRIAPQKIHSERIKSLGTVSHISYRLLLQIIADTRRIEWCALGRFRHRRQHLFHPTRLVRCPWLWANRGGTAEKKFLPCPDFSKRFAMKRK